MKYTKRYIKTPVTKNHVLKIRLTEEQKNDLTRWAFNQDKTITQVVLESIKKKRKEFPI